MPDAKPPARYASLDGLRGIAALIVVVHHALFTSATFARVYYGHHPPHDAFAYALTYTPLHLLWDGKAAVIVFFVLSGFVLGLPFDPAGSRTQSWVAYYPRRLIRMLLPIWGAVALAATLAMLIPRGTGFPSVWMNLHAHQLRAGTVVHDLIVVRGASNLDTPLWSMQWEVYFSLLLPLFAGLGFWARSAWMLKATAALAMCGVGWLLMIDGRDETAVHALAYLPIFLIGVCLASVRDQIGAAFSRVGRLPSLLLCAVALLLINAAWTTYSVGTQVLPLLLASLASIVGAALLVALFVGSPTIARVGTTRWAAWLGRVSFSLYLIHQPIVVSVKNLVPGLDAFGVLIASVALSLPAAWVFYKLIEAPAFRLARRVGAMAQARFPTPREPSLLTPEPSLLTPEPSLLTPEPSLLTPEPSVGTT